MPASWAARTASATTSRQEAVRQAKMPPVWNQRTPRAPKRRAQSTSPGCMCEVAECPRSYRDTLPRGPAPTSVKLSPMRRLAAHPVVGDGHRLGEVHPGRPGVVAHDAAQGVVDQAAHPPGAQAQARQGVSHVVLPAADVDLEVGGELDAVVSGRAEADHALAQADQVELALVRRPDLQRHVFPSRRPAVVGPTGVGPDQAGASMFGSVLADDHAAQVDAGVNAGVALIDVVELVLAVRVHLRQVGDGKVESEVVAKP